MPDRRDLIAIVATVVADAAWLYPVLALFSVIFVQGAWPLPPTLILAVIALGVVVCRAVSGVVADPANRASAQALLGLGTVYIAVSAPPSAAAAWGFWPPAGATFSPRSDGCSPC